MNFSRWSLPVVGAMTALIPMSVPSVAAAVVAGPQIALSPWLSPASNLSSSGDFATDTFSDPWDFSNAEDFATQFNVGAGFADGASIANGVLSVATRNASEIRLLMKWAGVLTTQRVLPWGRDGWAHPIDGGRYNQTTFRIRSDVGVSLAVRWWNAGGESGVLPFNINAGDWQTLHFDLTDHGKYPFPGSDAAWGGPIVRFEIFRAGALAGGNPQANVQLDWVRLHRPDASQTPPSGLAVPKVLTPNETGGADYATVERANPWDFAGLDDVAETHDVASIAISGGDLTGASVANDPFIGLSLGRPIATDTYHRLTLDVCYSGNFDLGDVAGGGMVGRMAWMAEDDLPPVDSSTWTETQDFVVFPGCHKVSMDMATNPPAAIHDEHSTHLTGWRGAQINRLRFDLNEDRGHRAFTIRNVTLADDAAFSTSYPITFVNGTATPSTTADIYVTTTRGGYDGTKIASGLAVAGGTTTFNWTGVDSAGALMPNATYWVYIVMRNTVGVGVGYATGPLRLQKPVPATPSYYVPLTPARLLDTRTGEGGNIIPLSQQWSTKLDVTGVGGVPETNVTAVVLNVTAADPTAPGFLTAWPSGEPRPLVSSLNFVPGQTVPNLVTVKVGDDGRVELFNSTGTTHVIADVAGYYTSVQPSSGGRFTAVSPARILDTRIGTGAAAAPIGHGQEIQVAVTGVGGVPATGVDAVALNVTVDQPTSNGFLTVWPSGQPRPTASTHNFVPGLTVANLVLAKVGSNGRVSVFNSAGSTHVIADVVGYFSSSGGLFVPVTPQRLVDTRESVQMGTGGTHTMAVANSSPVPAEAKAVVVNVTSVNSSSPSFITVWPTAGPMPIASTLNPRPGFAVPNQAYLRVGAGGSLDAFNASGSTDLVVDVFGYIM